MFQTTNQTLILSYEKITYLYGKTYLDHEPVQKKEFQDWILKSKTMVWWFSMNSGCLTLIAAPLFENCDERNVANGASGATYLW